MNSHSRCPQCGGQLAPTTGDPMCPACLMRGVLHPTDSESDESHLTHTRSVRNGGQWDSMRSIGETSTPVELLPDSMFGDYRIISRLGRGGMGVVYEADHIPTSRRVALKVLSQSLDQPEARARFLREGRLAASINHPNSVYVYGTEEIDGIPTITMELVSGGTLTQQIKTGGPMPIRQAVDALIQIIDGLAAADKRGVLHRDVKPSNCFVAPDGTVKVGDFGLSISTTGSHQHSMTDVTIEGTFLGTPAFASPEQLRGEPLDRRSDIYSVGVTLFYLLTGKVPFDADNMIHLLATVLDKPAPSAASIRGEIPVALDAVITKCLQKPAGSRFQNYEALRVALKPFSSDSPIAASLGNRTLAGIIDAAICWAATVPISFLTASDAQWSGDYRSALSVTGIALPVAVIVAYMAYYAIGEWRFGYSIGKRILKLRVCSGDDRPSFAQSSLRAFLFIGLPTIPSVVFNLANLHRDSFELQMGTNLILLMLIGSSYYILKFGLFATARTHNGFQAIHDRLSGTQVFERPTEIQSAAERSPDEPFEFNENTPKIGPYYRLQSLFERENEQLILGYDAKLLRRVWLHVQPFGSPAATESVKDDRNDLWLRWLGGRRSADECWDCYEAPDGRPLGSLDSQIGGTRGIRILRRLVDRLRRIDVSRVQLPTSVYNLWTTDQDEFKILPFQLPEQCPATDEPSFPSTENGNKHVNLIRQTASRLIPTVPSGPDEASAWSLGAINAIKTVREVQTIDQAGQILSQSDLGRPVRIRPRVLGLTCVSLIFPIMTVVMGLVSWMIYDNQEQLYPEIKQLHEVSQVFEREQRLLTADRLDRMTAMEHYVAGNFGDLLNDQPKMNTLYAITKITIADRIELRKAVDKHLPTADELAAANKLYPELRQEWIADPGPTVNMTLSFWTSLGPAYSWLEFIWFPSMVTGILFRGGLLLRLFGLVFVNRHGQRASRLRVFLRMFISGLPVMGIVMLNIYTWSRIFSNIRVDQVSLNVSTIALLIIVAAIMVIVPYFRGNQFLSDRFAGTYLTAK